MPCKSKLKLIENFCFEKKRNYQIVVLHKALGSFDQIKYNYLKYYNVLSLRCKLDWIEYKIKDLNLKYSGPK